MPAREQYRKEEIGNQIPNRAKYSQLGFEIRERTLGFKVIIVSLVITLAFGGSLKEILKELENMFEKMICVN